MDKMILGICGPAGSGKDTVASLLSHEHFRTVALADPLKRIVRDTFDFSYQQLWGVSRLRNEPDKRYPRSHSWEMLPPRVVSLNPIPTLECRYSCACCGQEGERRLVSRDERDEQWITKALNDEPCYLTPRYALQKLGTEFGRTCYPNVWVDIAMRTAKQLIETPLVYYSQPRGLELVQSSDIQFIVNGVVIPDVRHRNEIEAIRAGGGKVIRVVRPGAGLQGATGKHTSETEQASIPDADFDYVLVNDGSLEDLARKAEEMLASFRERGGE